MTPNSVNERNARALWERLYGGAVRQRSPRFTVGDSVRISLQKTPFRKGYEPTFTDQIYRVERVFRTPLPTYCLRDANNAPISGHFYEPELCGVDAERTAYRIERVLRTRTNSRGIREHLVKWAGYSDEYNSWVAASRFL
ncbi:hypothetical protein M3Y98_00093800 [Aphelenchoides besseyi]|nr:hypothetical protein M3Y98_01014300 [Aphelenchoides besseyi]KAI6186079.1 hypothetical protein M3Y98_00093800 [Aphelenchoides besseyi]KAI6210133.1 hypothetical protein M3Y96_00295500 [Aphelenchoides besseyi]